jgi:DNA-binding NarL/FixJ family response regulator
MTGKARIFIVDDHPLVREWLGTLLRQQPDFELCGQAEDVPTALAGMLKARPDVAIVDLSLQSGSGLDLIKDMRVQLPEVAVIVLSMHEEIYYAERALRAGARGYIMKRESTGRIVDAIRRVRAGHVYASEEMLARLAERMVGGRAAASPQGPVATLSDREIEVFRRLGQGQTTRQIATDLNVSMKTVQAYCARIKEKLSLGSGAELVRDAVRWIERERHA